LTVSYGALKLLDPTGTDGIDICQLTTNVSAEMLPLPSQKFRWSNSGTELDPTLDIKPSMVDPYIELSVKVVFGATPKLANLTSLVGLVNSVTLYVADGSFEEDTVLLLGADLEQCVNVQGQPAWVRNLKFGIRNNDGLGWNGLWNPNSQAYEGIETVDSGDPPYASGTYQFYSTYHRGVMLGRNPLPKYDAGQSPIRANDLNKLAAEVKRLGQVKASPPLQVMSNATGVHFFLAGGPNSFRFAQLITQVNQNGSGTAWPYKVDSGGNWALNNGDDSNKITVFAPP